MLRKLLKHEFGYTAKYCLPTLGIMLLFVAATRLLAAILVGVIDDTNVRSGLETMMIMFNFFAMSVGPAVVMILMVLRFYRNMVRDEGYLTFTLPVKTSTLITSKLICAFVWQCAALVATIVSLVVTFVGTLAGEEIGRLGLAWGQIDMELREIAEKLISENSAMIYLVVIEIALIGVISTLSGILMYYAAIAIGQLFGGHKVLGAVISYIGLNFIMQIIGSLFSVPFVNSLYSLILKGFGAIIEKATLILFIYMLIMLLFGATYYLITNFVLSKRLNLE